MIKLIWAQDQKGVIGDTATNRLPWHLPDDFAYFKQQTSHQTIVMGRKTFDSINQKPLPNRLNLVLTRQTPTTAIEQVEYIDDYQMAIEIAQKHQTDLFVIGGSSVYQAYLPLADELLVTEIQADVAGDVLAPKIDQQIFQEISRQHHLKDEQHTYAFDFVLYRRK